MLKYKIPQIVTLILNPSGFYVDPKLTRSFCAKKTKILYKYLVEDLCDRDRIQTCNRLIRSQLLYSVELRGHYFVIASAKVALSFIFASLFGIFFLTNQASLG